LNLVLAFTGFRFITEPSLLAAIQEDFCNHS
jgi:hypothetical protein